MAKKRTISRRSRSRPASRDQRRQPQPLDAAYHEFARRRAAGEILVPPAMLPEEDRRLHIRRLSEDAQVGSPPGPVPVEQ